MLENPVKRKLKAGKAVAPMARIPWTSEGNIKTILRSALRHGVPAGIHCATPDTVNRRIREGWRFMGILGDLRFMTAAARAARDAIKPE